MLISIPLGKRSLINGYLWIIFFLVVASSDTTMFAADLPQIDSLATVELKRMSLEELMTMDITTVSRRIEKWSQAPASLQVLTNEEIRRSAATTFPEALQLAPNLTIARINSREWAISTRGSLDRIANKLLVLMDGRQIYTPLFSGVFWDVQDYFLPDVDRVEVISGPGASVWGANAVNGVINLLSTSSHDPTTHGLLLEGLAGTYVKSQAALRYGGELNDAVGFRFYGKHTRNGESATTNGTSGKDKWYQTRGGFRVDWSASEADEFTIQGDGYSGKAANSVPQDPSFEKDDIKVAGGNGIVRWSHILSNESDILVQSYYDYTHRTLPGLIKEDLSIIDIEAQHRWKFPDVFDFVWGLEYRTMSDRVTTDSFLVAFYPERLTSELYTGFIQGEIPFANERMRLLLGCRFEDNDFSGFEWQPTGRLSYSISENQTAWLSVSRAVRTPSRVDRDYHVFRFQTPGDPNDLNIQGGAGFTSEKLIAYEAGVRLQPAAPLFIENVIFHHQYDDIRTTTFPPLPFKLINGVEMKTYGTRITTNIEMFDWWRWSLSYQIFEKYFRAKPGAVPSDDGNDPEHLAHLQTRIDLPGNIQLDALMRYVSDLPQFFARVPEYFDGDIRLGWQASPSLLLSVAGVNVFHNRHAEFGFNTARYEMPRAVYAKMTLSLL